MKAPTLEQRIAALKRQPTMEALRVGLAGSWLLVAAAARLVEDACLYVLADDLVAAYARMFQPKLDPNCAARLALELD